MAPKKQPNLAFVTLKPVRHDGTRYEIGEEIEMTLAQAQPLLTSGTLAVVVADKESSTGDIVDLSTMTKAQLVEHAKNEHALELDPAAKKDDLVAAISQAAAKE